MGCSATDGHFARNCPKLEEYIRVGKCLRSPVDGRIVLPGNRFIPARIEGKDITERWRIFHSAICLRAKSSKFDGVVVPPRPPTPPKKTTKPPSTSLPSTSTVAPPANKGPALRYRSQIEEFIKVEEIIRRALSARMEITMEEMLAMYPDGRKHMKNLLMARKVPTVEATYATAEISSGLTLKYEVENMPTKRVRLTLSDIDSLRIIDPIVNDRVQVEAILDQGSEITAISKEVWEQTGAVLDPRKIFAMTSANTITNTTEGLITDLTFNLQGVELALQVHVVKNTPFDLLLRWPFFRFTSCQTYDKLDGSQVIMITCPNTGRVISVPTRRKS
ncbi:hypothetical protein C8R45DRAFT_833304 [Mycena sanguinolenta]|nr:hypothetical protein C8R45DRAFT_833304 [Mycena sanguinolenta]